MKRIIIGVSFIFFSQANAYASELYVKKHSGGEMCSHSHPCGNIQKAIDLADEGDTIIIDKGRYSENLFIETSGITLVGRNKRKTLITTAGGREGATGNAGNPLDAIIEVRAADVTITNLTITHLRGNAIKREAAIFAWKGSPRLTVTDNIIARKRNMRTDEPTTPGSRGVFIFDGPGGLIEDNIFMGNYQDHVHLPSREVTV